MIKSTKWSSLFSLILLLNIKFIESTISCSSNNDCTNFGNYSECVGDTNAICKCTEFFVQRSDDCDQDCCLKMASHGKSCQEDIQCQHLGLAKCEGTCQCSGSILVDGMCIIRKAFGESCKEDIECMNGTTNEMLKCINTFCDCYMNHEVGLHTEQVDGICMVAAMEDCNSVDISVLAVTVAGSVVLLLFIYVMFRLATKDRKKEDEMSILKTDDVKLDQHQQHSVMP